MTQSTQDILIAAKALIDTPEKWIKGKFFDRRVKPRTYCYCAVGAISQAGYSLAGRALDEDAISAASVGAGLPAKTYWKPLSNWNDAPERTHADVMAAFDRAIAAASSAMPKPDEELRMPTIPTQEQQGEVL